MKKMLFLALVMLTLVSVGTVYADIEISGHVVTVWSDAQHDEKNNPGSFAVTPIALGMGSGPVTRTANPISNGQGGGGANARGAANFAVAEVELDVEADITDNISTRIDIEMTDNATFDVEAAYIKLVQPFDVPFDVIVGKFVAPIGVEPQEQIDRKLITASLPDAALPNTLEGIAITGTISAIDYVIFYVNDLAAGDNDRGAVNTDNSRAIGARLATSPLEGLDIGIAYANESLTTVDNTFATADKSYYLWDLDAVYANGPWELRGEFLKATEKDTDSVGSQGIVGNGGSWGLDAWSAQLAYDVDEQINLVARYAQSKPDQELARTAAARHAIRLNGNGIGANDNSVEISVLSMGASYAFSENAIFKLEYSSIDTKNVANVAAYDPKDDVLAMELTVAF